MSDGPVLPSDGPVLPSDQPDLIPIWAAPGVVVMTDSTPENPNVHYRESLTVWGQTMSAQVRGLATVAMHHYDDAPRSTENGQPYLLTTLDAVLLRDVLNAATDRGFLPKAGGGDD